MENVWAILLFFNYICSELKSSLWQLIEALSWQCNGGQAINLCQFCSYILLFHHRHKWLHSEEALSSQLEAFFESSSFSTGFQQLDTTTCLAVHLQLWFTQQAFELTSTKEAEGSPLALMCLHMCTLRAVCPAACLDKTTAYILLPITLHRFPLLRILLPIMSHRTPLLCIYDEHLGKSSVTSSYYV